MTGAVIVVKKKGSLHGERLNAFGKAAASTPVEAWTTSTK